MQINRQTEGRNKLILNLMYGSGLRVSECLAIRVKDIDFDRSSLTINNGKGRKDRVTLLSKRLHAPLKDAINEAIAVQRKDNESNIGCSMPEALGIKYPSAYRTPSWAFIFPSTTICTHPYTGIQCRHHLHSTVIRKALKKAVDASGVYKRVTCHTFGTVSLLTCWQMELIYEQCKIYWAITVSKRLKYTHMYWDNILQGQQARLIDWLFENPFKRIWQRYLSLKKIL